jgi:hypothetical protein
MKININKKVRERKHLFLVMTSIIFPFARQPDD